MTCDPQAVLAKAQDLFRARLAALIQVKGSNPPHSAGNLANGWYTQVLTKPNGDTYYGGERHALNATASMEMQDNKLTVKLGYNIYIVPE